MPYLEEALAILARYALLIDSDSLLISDISHLISLADVGGFTTNCQPKEDWT
jgi:hypothetical protein